MDAKESVDEQKMPVSFARLCPLKGQHHEMDLAFDDMNG
jgi:hypothetical protein